MPNLARKELVRDRGVGIAPDHLDRIFEPYFTTKGDNGNGLGLRNVWQIVTGAGGQGRGGFHSW
jgi:C4-dicarboxylate-specific signal transduction histidine kinase